MMSIAHIVLITISFSVFGFNAVANEFLPRIIDNDDTDPPTKYPWVASVRVENVHKCMGNIIGKQLILCSAACVSLIDSQKINPSSVNVRIGSVNQYAGGEIVEVADIKIHHSFAYHMYNIAILKLKKPLIWSKTVNKIKIPNESFNIPDGTSVVVNGWNLLKSDAMPYKLKEANFTVLSQSRCELEAGYGYESTLCLAHAINEGTCWGDEGAGCVYNNTLVGIISFAFGGCGSQYPDIATKISYFSDWIKLSKIMFGFVN